MFVFELESNIFIFSSKDKDFLKPIKQNNVIGYLIFLLMLELNESQISMMNNDKKGFCNFFIFEKIYESLYMNNKNFGLREIMELFRKEPDIYEINKKYVDNTSSLCIEK